MVIIDEILLFYSLLNDVLQYRYWFLFLSQQFISGTLIYKYFHALSLISLALRTTKRAPAGTVFVVLSSLIIYFEV